MLLIMYVWLFMIYENFEKKKFWVKSFIEGYIYFVERFIVSFVVVCKWLFLISL